MSVLLTAFLTSSVVPASTAAIILAVKDIAVQRWVVSVHIVEFGNRTAPSGERRGPSSYWIWLYQLGL